MSSLLICGCCSCGTPVVCPASVCISAELCMPDAIIKALAVRCADDVAGGIRVVLVFCRLLAYALGAYPVAPPMNLLYAPNLSGWSKGMCASSDHPVFPECPWYPPRCNALPTSKRLSTCLYPRTCPCVPNSGTPALLPVAILDFQQIGRYLMTPEIGFPFLHQRIWCKRLGAYVPFKTKTLLAQHYLDIFGRVGCQDSYCSCPG